jgi:hypothetical protein
MQDTIQKILKAKRGWDMAQVVECLLGKHKALSSKLQYAKKEK